MIKIVPYYTKKESHSQYQKSSQSPRTVTPENIQSLLIAGESFKINKTASIISTKPYKKKGEK